jgi:hypothetical protein
MNVLKKGFLIVLINIICFLNINQATAQSGTNCFNTQFNKDATNYNVVNAYLLAYLSTMSYPDYLRFLEPSPIPGPDSDWVKYFQHRNDTFVRKYADRLAHLFYDPNQSLFTVTNPDLKNISTDVSKNINLGINIISEPNVTSRGGGRVTFDFQYRCNTGGYDPEAIIISTATTIYVVFRGTDRVACNTNPVLNNFGFEWGEWVGTDFKFLKRTWPNVNGELHRGFIESLTFAGFADSVGSRIKNRYGGANKKVWITGHSLGGAHAQLFTLLLKINWGITAQGLYIFSSPHPGDAAFATQLNNALGSKNRIQRFEFLDDPIPTLPPQMPPFSYGRAGVRNYFEDITKVKSGSEQIAVWDDFKFICGLSNLGLNSTVKLEIIAGCGGAFCYHHPTWPLKAIRNHVPSSVVASLPGDVPLPLTGEGTCTSFQVTQGRLNNIAANTADALEKFISDLITSGINVLNNLLGTVPGITDGAKYKIACYGFSRNNDKKYIRWNGTDKSQVTISTSGTTFTVKHKLTGGYHLMTGDARLVADVKVPNLGGQDARNTNKVLVQKNGNYPFGVFGDEDTWYLIPISQNAYAIYNVNTKCILDTKYACLTGGDCGVTNIPSNTPDRTQIWILEKQ